jgi:hypothetical protein
MMVDSDIEPPRDVLKLVDHDVDIVSADIHTNLGTEIIKL